MSTHFTTGEPITFDDLARIVADITAVATVARRDPYGGVACFQVVGVSPGSLHRIYNILRNAGVSVRANDSGAVPSVLVREAPAVAAPEPAAQVVVAVKIRELMLEAAAIATSAEAIGDAPGVVLAALNLTRAVQQLLSPELVTDAKPGDPGCLRRRAGRNRPRLHAAH